MSLEFGVLSLELLGDLTMFKVYLQTMDIVCEVNF